MARLGIIAGTGAAYFPQFDEAEVHEVRNDFGTVVDGIARWQDAGHEILFLLRHGRAGNIPPHRVNYRANIRGLCELGADSVLALNAVGGITPQMEPGKLVLPHQLIDYTWGREHTYYADADGSSAIEFIDFTDPYSNFLREKAIQAAGVSGLDVVTRGVYGVTQGPRLETAAEINRLERDGCDIVGMTGMPEAALARELGLPYASCSIVVNWAAGRSSTAIHAEISVYLRTGMLRAAALSKAMLQLL